MNILLETDRLKLSEMTMDMAMDVHKNSLDEDTRRFVPDEVFETLEDAKETVEFLMSQYGAKEGPLVYALITRDGDRNIGYVQLVPIGDGKWEIGYHVAKTYTCKGYATEAVRAFLPVMAKRVGIKEVYGIRLLENVASGRVLDKCGFRTFFSGEGAYHDGVYEISKGVWSFLRYEKLTAERLDTFIRMRIGQLREEGATEDIDLVPHLQDYYKRHMADGTFVSWLALDGEKIVGTSGMSFVEKPPYFSCPSGKLGLLSSMFTDPDYRRMGIARELLHRVVEEARAYGCGAVHITASDMGVKLYTAYGFEHNGNFMQYKL